MEQVFCSGDEINVLIFQERWFCFDKKLFERWTKEWMQVLFQFCIENVLEDDYCWKSIPGNLNWKRNTVGSRQNSTSANVVFNLSHTAFKFWWQNPWTTPSIRWNHVDYKIEALFNNVPCHSLLFDFFLLILHRDGNIWHVDLISPWYLPDITAKKESQFFQMNVSHSGFWKSNWLWPIEFVEEIF